MPEQNEPRGTEDLRREISSAAELAAAFRALPGVSSLAPGLRDLVKSAAARLLRRVDVDQRAAVMASIDASGVSLTPWVQEFQVHRSDGALRWIRGSATPQREPDGRVLWHGYFQDLTEWQALARAGTISASDLDLIRYVETADEAVAIIDAWSPE